MDREEYYARLRAAVTARNDLKSDMLIIARTDAKQSYGFDEALQRLQDAVEIGVDIVFFEAITSEEEARKVCEIFKKTNTPCLLNMVPGSVTPTWTAAEAKDIGYRIMIAPGICLGPMVQACTGAMEHLKTQGALPPPGKEGGSPVGVFNVCGLQECIQMDQRAGGKAYDTVGKN